MNHGDLRTLLDFNYWARDRMLESVAALSDELYAKPMGNSFSSVRDTIVHMYSAEWVWCSRWHGTSPTSPIKVDEYPDLATLTAAWRDLEARIRAFLDGLGADGITRELDYKQMNGQEFRSPVWQMVQHVVNHGSYHRGQVATLLRQLGAKPAGTDLIAFYRGRKIPS